MEIQHNTKEGGVRFNLKAGGILFTLIFLEWMRGFHLAANAPFLVMFSFIAHGEAATLLPSVGAPSPFRSSAFSVR